ncbi:MAG: DUF357 domain-containing protein [Nanoarchaeota archaeon]
MNNKITKQKLEKYYKLTSKALDEVKKKVVKAKKKDADEIIKMASAYLSDSRFFEKKGDLINAFGSIYYAHGWIDCGVRLGVFDVKDDKLFTVK